MARKIVVIQGSPSDTSYVEKLASALSGIGVPVERRIASAHRTPDHLQRILGHYEDSSHNIVYVTVAGLSDALSGTVAAKFSGLVVACPPDYEKHGEAKRFSSAKTPSGVYVQFAANPEEAVALVRNTFDTYDFSKSLEAAAAAHQKRDETIIADARLQGVEEPALPHTIFRRGKTRDVYDLGDGTLQVRATDRVSAFDVVLPERVPGKGKSLTDLSEYWFHVSNGLMPNHLVERLDGTSVRVRKAERIDIEWIARGYIYGSLWREYQKGARFMYGMELPDGLELAGEFTYPVLTPTTKSDVGHDEPITKEEAIAKGLVRSAEEWDFLAENTIALYRFYRGEAKNKGLIIPDFKIEFGILDGDYIQIDEPPNHDSARIWSERFYRRGEKQEGHAMDKEFLRQYLLGIGYKGDGPPPHLPQQVVDQVSRRCTGAVDALMRGTDVTSMGLKTVEEIMQELCA